MNRVQVIHLAPADRVRSGIASYADIVDQIFARYLADRYELRRVAPNDYLWALAATPSATVLAQMGSNEGEIFHVLERQRHERPGVRRVIEIHDPPSFVLSYTPFLDRAARTLPGRFLRRAVDRVLGDRHVRRFVRGNDIYVCKTAAGVAALELRFRRLGLDARVERIDLPNYTDAPPVGRLPEAPRVGFFGYIHPRKGPHLLVEGAIRLAAARGLAATPDIVIRGALADERLGSYIEGMKRRVAHAGLSGKVIIDGFVPFEELPGFVAGLSAIALPYMDRTRASASGPLLWARTAEVPVLAHRSVVFESCVHDGVDGLLLSLGDIDAWAEALAQVATGEEWRRRMRPGVEQAQARASWAVIANEYARVLDTAARGGL